MKHLYCSFFGHDYTVTKNVTYHVKEYACKHCKEQVTTTLLTPKYKEIKAILERIHDNKIKKKNIPVIDLSESSLFRLA